LRSLFVRILLTFWLTNALVMMAGTLVYWTAPPRPDLRAIMAELVRPRALEAADALTVGDRARAAATLDELAALGGPRIVLFSGEEVVLGEPDRAGAPALAAEALAANTTRTTTLDGTELVAVPLGPDYPDMIAVGHAPVIVRLFSSALTVRLIVLVLLSGLVSFLLARYVARPIQAVRAASNALASGDTSVRVAASVEGRQDEIAQLAHDFDRMAERVEELLGVQSRLLLDVSHELRSPLARLTVGIELARQKMGPEGQPALDRMERETERLAELVSEVLTLARLEHHEKTAEEDVEFEALLRELVDATQFEAEAVGKRVELSVEGPLSLRGDEELLRRALENVLRNAVRFTADQGAVDVTAVSHDTSVSITVRDHGPGVPPEALEGIFRPFYRVGTARDRATGGTGLGLAIAYRAIRAHKGTVTAENHEGGGLAVTLDIPRARAYGPRTSAMPIPVL